MDETVRDGVRAVLAEAITRFQPSAVQLLDTMQMINATLMCPVSAQIKKETDVLEDERDFALADLKLSRDDKARMETSIRSLESEEKKLMDELAIIRKEAADSKEAIEAQNIVLEQARGEIAKLGDEILFSRKDTKRKMEVQSIVLEQARGEKAKLADELLLSRKETKRKMEAQKRSLENCKKYRVKLRQVEYERLSLAGQLASTEMEKNELQDAHERCQRSLAEEKEKSLCEICMQSQKDSLCLPCLHLRYCFGCLEKHRGSYKTCPCCRVLLNGVIRSNISMFTS